MDAISEPAVIYSKLVAFYTNGSSVAYLATIDVFELTVTVIAEIPGLIASLTIDCFGNLYALTTVFGNDPQYGLLPGRYCTFVLS